MPRPPIPALCRHSCCSTPSCATCRRPLVQRLAIRALGIFGAGMWTSYYKSLYKATPPADLPAYLKALKASLKEPGRFAATLAMARGSHAAVEARLGEVRAPALVVMGSKDPDFPDPAAEADRTAASLRGSSHTEIQMIEGAGHYPHAERPDLVAAAITRLPRANAGVGGPKRGAVRPWRVGLRPAPAWTRPPWCGRPPTWWTPRGSRRWLWRGWRSAWASAPPRSTTMWLAWRGSGAGSRPMASASWGRAWPVRRSGGPGRTPWWPWPRPTRRFAKERPGLYAASLRAPDAG